MLALLITGSTSLLSFNVVLAMALITPLFQTNGYQAYMGIIDASPTYTFFYALPLLVLLIYFTPFVFEFYHGRKINSILIKLIWIPLAFVVCLSGPLNTEVALVFVLLAVLFFFKHKTKLILHNYFFYLLPVVLLSSYSLYIGSFNVINTVNIIPLTTLYANLPLGVYYQFIQKLGFPILLTTIAINIGCISCYFNASQAQQIITTLKWIALFCAVYILVLPLGGYRHYRTNTLRYDTIMPVTLCLFFVVGLTTMCLLKSFTAIQKRVYVPFLLLIGALFTNADKPEFENNTCERAALQHIATAIQVPVAITNDCKVLAWNKTTISQDSQLNAQLLCIWHITVAPKLYFNKEEE